MKKTFVQIYNFFYEYRLPLFIFLTSRIIVWLVVLLTELHISKEASLSQWDAKHFLRIAENGYQWNGRYTNEGAEIAFFPLFPLAIRLLGAVSGLNPETAGFLLVFLFGAAATVLLYIQLLEWKGKETAIAGTTLMVFAPSSIFLSSNYSESLFLLLVLSTFYFLQKNSYRKAALSTALALITRITGIILLPLFAYRVWLKTKNSWQTGLGCVAALLPFIAFLIFQYLLYGTPFAFLEAQKANWNHSGTFPLFGLWFFLKNVFSGNDLPVMWRTDFIHLLIATLTLIFSWKKVPSLIWWFGLGVVLLTLSQTVIIGMGRYLFLVLPIYFYWGEVFSRKKILFQTAIVFYASWLTINVLLFSLSKAIF